MDGDEQETARLLAALREFTPGGPGTVDLDRARRTGRRSATVRHVASTTVAAVVLIAAIAGPPWLGRLLDEEEAPPIAPSTDQFSTGLRAFTVGSAGGFTPSGYESGRYVQRITLRKATPSPGRPEDGVIEIYARGRLPAGAGGRTPTGRTADPVHGRRAYWPTRPVLRPGTVELAWEWSPGAWAFVSLKGQGVDRARAHHVAQSVLRADTPVERPTSWNIPSGTPSETPSVTPSGSSAPTGP